MSLIFPNTLRGVSVNGYTETPRELSIVSSVDVGIARRRRIATALPTDVAMNFRLTSDQYETLDRFYIESCLGGVLPFYFQHPRLQDTVVARFTKRPTVSAINGVQYDVSVAMEFMP